jgi:OOP family OmpA-OmpF porin
MKKTQVLSIFTTLCCLVALPASALEILTEEDFVNGVVVEDQLVPLANNAIFLLDTSSSMNDEFRDTGMSQLEFITQEFKRRAAYFPEIGINFGIYEYTPWKEIYPVQKFNRDAIAEAMNDISEKGSGPTPLAKGIEEATEVISSLDGRTVVFLFYDGDYTGRNANPGIWRMVRENDVCLILITSAPEEENEMMQQNFTKLNSCSRVIPYDYFVDRAEYQINALYDVRATETIVTTTAERVVGVEVNDIVFGFDKTELTADDKSELDAVGEYMAANPDSYAVLAGYTDNVGVEDYNEHLSQLRTEMVAEYLSDEHDIDESRLVLHWHGSDNPIASNSTEEGRAANRRVEVAIGGI